MVLRNSIIPKCGNICSHNGLPGSTPDVNIRDISHTHCEHQTVLIFPSGLCVGEKKGRVETRTCLASFDARAASSCSSSSHKMMLRYSVPMSRPCRFPCEERRNDGTRGRQVYNFERLYVGVSVGCTHNQKVTPNTSTAIYLVYTW